MKFERHIVFKFKRRVLQSYRLNTGILYISNVIRSKQPRFPNHLKNDTKRKNEQIRVSIFITLEFPLHHNMMYTKRTCAYVD